MQPNVRLFAEAGGKRPSGKAIARAVRARGLAWKRGPGGFDSAETATPAVTATSHATRGVRVDRAGAKLLHGQPRSETPARGEVPAKSRPLTRELPTSLARAACRPERAYPKIAHERKHRARSRKTRPSLHEGRGARGPPRGPRGSCRSQPCSWDVLIAEIDERRVAESTRERRAHGSDFGLAPPTEEERRSVENRTGTAKSRDRE